MRIGTQKIKDAIRYVKQDIKDDFWPDVLEYADYLDDTSTIESKDFNSYSPNPPIVLDIPKPTLILRPGHFIRLLDRIYYQILVGGCANMVDKKILDRNIVFAHRVNSGKASGKRFFHDGVEAWKRFNQKTEKLFNDHPGGFLLKTDISAYFEHIKIKKLCEILKQIGVKSDVVVKIESLLSSWFEDGIGIPQGYDVSSFLGNVYLHEVDQAMIASGFTYYRFADDIRVFALEDKDIRRAVSKLTELMRPLNLHLSGGKTSIINKTEYLSKNNVFADEMDAINYSLDVSKLTDETEESLKKIWFEIFKNGQFNKSAFNFCLYRFRRINSEIPLKTLLAKNLFDPSYSPLVCSYLENHINKKRVQDVMLSVFQNTAYDYQKIFLLKTFIKVDKIKFNPALIDENSIYQSGNFMLIGFYFVFMAKFGNAGQKAVIKSKFNNSYKDDEKVGRYFLIALQYFPNPTVEMNQLLKTKPILVDTVKYLKKKKS